MKRYDKMCAGSIRDSKLVNFNVKQNKVDMKKENMLKMLEIIYDEANNCITASRANNYWFTVNEMTEERYNSVKSFYLEFVHEFFKSI